MKNINSLINTCFYENFDELKNEYNEREVDIEKLLKEQENFETKQGEKDTLNISDINKIYAIMNLANKHLALDCNVEDLIKKIESKFPDLIEYRKILNRIYRKRLLNGKALESIDFNMYGTPGCKHLLVRTSDEIICLKCNASTKEYNIKEEDLLFLQKIAEYHGIFAKDFDIENIALLEVLKQELDYYKSKRKDLSEIENDGFMDASDWQEEYALADEYENFELLLEIKKANMLDKGLLKEEKIRITDPKYLSEERTTKILEEIETKIEKIKMSESRFKELLLEICQTAKYEVLILSGKNIPNLFQSIEDKAEKIALVKAYYNLSNQEYRINTNYFGSINDAVSYFCRTANSEINKKILELKK